MDQGEKDPTEAVVEDAAFFGIADILVLTVLIGGVYWWFFLREKKAKPVNNFKTYTIQPTQLTTQQSETNFIGKMKSSGRNVVVFYGSQTGTAEEFAGRLAKEAAKYKMKGMVADPEECEMEELPKLSEIENSIAIFCLATYGEGDPTDNAQEFFEWLQNRSDDMNGIRYTVFGLGNKTYEHYNDMAKFVDKKLEELGAQRVFELGLGDDDANIEEDFITWKDRFWPAICDHFGIDSSGEDVSMRQYVVKVVEDVDKAKVYTGEVARLHSYKHQRPPFEAKNPFMAPIVVNRELHKSGIRSCMHIEILIDGSKIRYDAGDHVAIYPKNDPELVNRIGQLLDTDLDTVVTFTNLDEDSSKKYPFPCPSSYRTALSYYVDITSIPRTHVLKELVEYASDEKEKKMLQDMSGTSPEGKELYSKWIGLSKRNIIHILEDLPSCKPPLDYLCELLPRLQARYYSISSSPKVHSKHIHITGVVVEYETLTNRVNKGVATTWLKKLYPTSKFGEKTANGNVEHVSNGNIPNADVVAVQENLPRIPIFVRRSAFRLPTRPQTPIILIGPGTGLAPFRGFIQERNFLKEEGKPVGETILFFGCRNKSEDYIYQEELEDYVKKGILKIHVAFSRDQEQKIYVTHLLQAEKKEVWRIIGVENGHLYVCGDARSMARDVHDIITKVAMEEGSMTESQAQAFVKKMESNKRYCSDVWS